MHGTHVEAETEESGIMISVNNTSRDVLSFSEDSDNTQNPGQINPIAVIEGIDQKVDANHTGIEPTDNITFCREVPSMGAINMKLKLART